MNIHENSNVISFDEIVKSTSIRIDTDRNGKCSFVLQSLKSKESLEDVLAKLHMATIVLSRQIEQAKEG